MFPYLINSESCRWAGCLRLRFGIGLNGMEYKWNELRMEWNINGMEYKWNEYVQWIMELNGDRSNDNRLM